MSSLSYGELKTYIRDYVMRSDLSDTNFDIWQDNVTAKLNRDTDIVQMDKSETISNPSGDTIFPIDSTLFLFMDTLQSISVVGSDGIAVPLVQVSWEQFIEAQAIGIANGITQPWCYCMFSTGIKVAPGNQADFVFNVIFRAADKAMNSDAVSNTYLTWAQPLYIEAMLIEVYKFLRDVEGEQLATARYNSEVTAFNNYLAWQKTGGNPGASNGAWSWV